MIFSSSRFASWRRSSCSLSGHIVLRADCWTALVCVQEKHAGLPEASITRQCLLQLSHHRHRRERTPDGFRDTRRGLVRENFRWGGTFWDIFFYIYIYVYPRGQEQKVKGFLFVKVRFRYSKGIISCNNNYVLIWIVRQMCVC